MSAIEVKDPFRGVPYSDIIAQDPKLYRETQPPLRRVAGTGKATWISSMGRYVV